MSHGRPVSPSFYWFPLVSIGLSGICWSLQVSTGLYVHSCTPLDGCVKPVVPMSQALTLHCCGVEPAAVADSGVTCG